MAATRLFGGVRAGVGETAEKASLRPPDTVGNTRTANDHYIQ